MRQRRLMNQINVVPYIDVMLVLLVIFMVTAPMIQTGSVDLPSVDRVPQPPAEAMTVTVRKDGTIAFQPTTTATPQPITSAELRREIDAAIGRNPEQPVLVAADKQVRYEEVMNMLDALRKAGVRKVSLVTQAGSGG